MARKSRRRMNEEGRRRRRLIRSAPSNVLTIPILLCNIQCAHDAILILIVSVPSLVTTVGVCKFHDISSFLLSLHKTLLVQRGLIRRNLTQTQLPWPLLSSCVGSPDCDPSSSSQSAWPQVPSTAKGLQTKPFFSHCGYQP